MTETPPYDHEELIGDITAIEERLAAIRLKLEGSDPAPAGPIVEVGEEEDLALRQLLFLHAFYAAPAHALTAPQASEAAKRAGYDPRGTAGFYVGTHSSLKSVGAARVLTDTGRNWYEATAPDYQEEIAAHDGA